MNKENFIKNILNKIFSSKLFIALKSGKKATWILLLLSVSCIAFIMWNASRTGEESRQWSDAITDTIKDTIESTNKIPSGFEGTQAIQSTAPDDNSDSQGNQVSVNTYYLKIFIRKSGHLLEYTLLAFLLALFAVSFDTSKDKSFIFSLILGIMVAISDEAVQHSTRGRVGKVADVMVDFCGCIMGAFFAISVLVFVFEIYRQRKNENTIQGFNAEI